jgi:hypothetical protein
VEPDHDEVDVAGWAVVTRRPGRQVEQLVLSGDRVQRVRGAVDPGPHVLDESAVVGIARTARTVADLAVQRSVPMARRGLFRALVALVSFDNVGNVAVYDQCGLPQPGRTVRLTMSLR